MKTQTETIIRRSITAELRKTYHLQGVGCRRGFPDLTVMKDGQTIYIEVKTETGKQSDYQKEFEQICKAHGCTYILARSTEDIADLLNYKPLF